MSETMNIGLLLLIPYRAMESRVFDRLAASGFGDMTRAQARVLQRIAPTGSRSTDLAAQVGITKQSAGFLVDQLERAGYVDRVPDPADGRARLIRIADRGARAVRAAGRTVAEVEAEWTAHLGTRRTAQLRDILTDLREITDPWQGSTPASDARAHPRPKAAPSMTSGR